MNRTDLNTEVTFTNEFDGDCGTAPASYWLRSWSHDPKAVKAITEAAQGKMASWYGPCGENFVSPAR
jgi:hypothetical protein